MPVCTHMCVFVHVQAPVHACVHISLSLGDQEPNSERSKAAPQMEGVIIIITMIIVIKMIMLA